MHGFHQSQVANCNSATGCTKPSQTYSLAPLSYSTSSPSSSASSRLLLSCTSEYPKLERVIITTCKNLATERGLCTQCTPSLYGVAGILDTRILREGVAALLAAMKRAWLSAAYPCVVDHYWIPTSYSSTICRRPLSSAARR